MRLLLFTFLFLDLFSANAQTLSAILKGFLKDSITKQELISASVKVTRNDTIVKGTITDFNGSYRIPLEPGVYNIVFSYTGYKTISINHLEVAAGQIKRQDALFTLNQNLNYYFCRYGEFKIPLIDKSPDNSGISFTSEMLRNMY